MPLSKKCYIIAGPNGAGKTTFANEFLPADAKCLNFVNADLIAYGLSPFKPDDMAIEAGRLMLQNINSYVSRDESFAFETTLSGKGYRRKIVDRSEEHTSELQSHSFISYAVFCLKKKKKKLYITLNIDRKSCALT